MIIGGERYAFTCIHAGKNRTGDISSHVISGCGSNGLFPHCRGFSISGRWSDSLEERETKVNENESINQEIYIYMHIEEK